MRFIPTPATGILSFILYTLSMLLSAALLVLTFLIDKLLPFGFIKKMTRWLYHVLPLFWVKMNRMIFDFSGNSLEMNLPPNLNTETFYAMISNHQSWADILVLYEVFSHRIPMLKFFMKQQLKWVPLVGQVTGIYGFPLLARHTHAELKKHPQWRQHDLEATRKACERFKKEPGSIMVFAEGTRFTSAKHKKQPSPYLYLLKPKAGGLALALQNMGDKIDTLIDVTIIYDKNHHSFWDYCCGRSKKISVHAKSFSLDDTLKGDYENNQAFRRHFQQFLNERWREKDQLIGQYYEICRQ